MIPKLFGAGAICLKNGQKIDNQITTFCDTCEGKTAFVFTVF